MNNDNGWAEYSRLVLKELETLAQGIKELNESLQDVKKEIAVIRAREDKVQELVKWKERIDEVDDSLPVALRHRLGHANHFAELRNGRRLGLRQSFKRIVP